MLHKKYKLGGKKIRKAYYTSSLAPADFIGTVFTWVHFQKIICISSLWDFHYISKGIFFRHVFLVNNYLCAADLALADFVRPKKIYKPRTGCTHLFRMFIDDYVIDLQDICLLSQPLNHVNVHSNELI